MDELDVISIEEFEKKKRVFVEEVEDVDFEGWWVKRSVTLGLAPHFKEILRADFTGRKLKKKETLEKWDMAAKAFGLKI